MRARILYVAAALCLLPLAARAQDRPRSASPRELPGIISRPSPAPGGPFRAGPGTYAPRRHPRPLTSRPSPALGDFFRAEPDTYTPRRHHPNRNIYALPVFLMPSYYSLGDVYYGSLPPYGNVPCAGVVRGCPVAPPYYDDEPGVRYDANGNAYAAQVPRNGPAAPPPPAAAPPVVPPLPAVPGPAKTFYVIAGCYAGDKPPQAERLPPDCDLSRVRVIPPR